MKKKAKPLESPRFLRFLCDNMLFFGGPSSCQIVLVFNPSMDLRQVEGTRGGDILAHEGFVGRRLTLSYRCGPPELKIIFEW